MGSEQGAIDRLPFLIGGPEGQIQGVIRNDAISGAIRGMAITRPSVLARRGYHVSSEGLAGQKVARQSCHLGWLDTACNQMDKSSLTPFSKFSRIVLGGLLCLLVTMGCADKIQSAQELVQLRKIPLSLPLSFEEAGQHNQVNFTTLVALMELDTSPGWNIAHTQWSPTFPALRQGVDGVYRRSWDAVNTQAVASGYRSDRSLASKYASKLSKRELAELLEFYRSPFGKKYLVYIESLRTTVAKGQFEAMRIMADPSLGGRESSLQERVQVLQKRGLRDLGDSQQAIRFYTDQAVKADVVSENQDALLQLSLGAQLLTKKFDALDQSLTASDKQQINRFQLSTAAKKEKEAIREWTDTVQSDVKVKALFEERQKGVAGFFSKFREQFLLQRGATSKSSNACSFAGVKLPQEYMIYAAGAYSGRKIEFQIDKSGHQATQIDVAVNSPATPVVLLLGAYEPTIWNIGWSSRTSILAVLVSGYHRQVVAGLPKDIPLLISSYDNKGPCGYFYVSEETLSTLNPVSRRLFARPIDQVFLVKAGQIVVGDSFGDNVKLVTSPETPPESFWDKNALLAGSAGLGDAVKQGILRRANMADAEAWIKALSEANPRPDIPPVAGQGIPKKPRLPSLHNSFVVLREFVYPAGLFGANRATFYVPKGVPLPTGNWGHSIVYDFNTMRCNGAICREHEHGP